MILVLFMGALLVVLGYFIGMYLFGSPGPGITLAGIVWAVQAATSHAH